ncbi:MAG: class I SAM-dependent methyltransferase [Acidobacteria bacterium]|nr:class I SAM-dependent methyltransferase [Acidobacteriota bacterium]
MGDGAKSAELLRGLIERHHPEARTVLELACGTGSLLVHLGRHYEVSGLDLSPRMLAIAKKKLPAVRLTRQNMTSFRFRERFDVILCVFDSINHLPHFDEWKETFRSAQRHLAEDGIFVFDINTRKKLTRLIAGPPWVHTFGRNVLVMEVTDAGGGISNWNIKVFEGIGKGRYQLHEENIPEVSFPLEEVAGAAREIFSRVKVIDIQRKRPSKESERLFFVCCK